MQNRLAAATIQRAESGQIVNIQAGFTYDSSGIRTGKNSNVTVNGSTTTSDIKYLMDMQNHTGYAQVLEEFTNGSLSKSYAISDDLLAQTSVNGSLSTSNFFLCDGHGSTRLLADANCTVSEMYDFDAYGVMPSGNPDISNPALTDILYSGEQFDPLVQMQYLRARYYDQNIGRFASLDPFPGNSSDPQSLHKYAYAHCDPVNGIDPSGKFTMPELLISIGLLVLVAAVTCPIWIAAINKARRTAGRLTVFNPPAQGNFNLFKRTLDINKIASVNAINADPEGFELQYQPPAGVPPSEIILVQSISGGGDSLQIDASISENTNNHNTRGGVRLPEMGPPFGDTGKLSYQDSPSFTRGLGTVKTMETVAIHRRTGQTDTILGAVVFSFDIESRSIDVPGATTIIIPPNVPNSRTEYHIGALPPTEHWLGAERNWVLSGGGN